MKLLKDFFSSCSPSNGKKVKAVKQKYSNLAPKTKPLQISKSQPNLEWSQADKKFQKNLGAENRKSKSKFYDVCDSTSGHAVMQNETNSRNGILENIDNYDLSSIAHALDTLRVGDRVVWVREVKGTTRQECGTVKWLGQIEGEEIAGIEFDRKLDLGSGWYKRRQLFSCAPDHGGLVAVAGLILEEDLDLSLCRHPGPSSTGSSTSPASSASSSLTKNKPSIGAPIKRRSQDAYDQTDLKRLSPKLFDPGNNYTKSESSSPSWSSGSSGGDLALASQLLPAIPTPSDYRGPSRWQGQDRREIDERGGGGHHYQNLDFDTVCYDQFDRASPDGCPNYVRNINHYGDSDNRGCGEYRNNNFRETDLDAAPYCQSAAIVMPSIPYIHPPLGEEHLENINGRPKGIQGNCNSCYLDATLFAMFSFTSVFDSILLWDASKKNAVAAVDLNVANDTQRILREEIVNPLRKDYLTPAANVMKLRETMYHLDDKLTSEEMDPQEFLQILFKKVLNLDEFISLSSGESDYFHQVLCHANENDREQIPTVQELFEQSLRQQNLKLKNVPSPALILQMPRSGNNYKTYKGILPNLTIDITDLIEDSPRECAICGELATHECPDCYGHFVSPNAVNAKYSGADSMSFCDTCVTPVHNKPERSTHKNITRITYSFPTELYFPPNLSNPNPNSSYSNNNFTANGPFPKFPSLPSNRQVIFKSSHRIPRVTMDLFAVICIETSHFVSFVKCGTDPRAPWVFFDSMADRSENISGKGYNIPQVKMLPKMGAWLSHLESQSQEQIREIMGNVTPELRRLLNDPYICLYHSPQSSMYI